MATKKEKMNIEKIEKVRKEFEGTSKLRRIDRTSYDTDYSVHGFFGKYFFLSNFFVCGRLKIDGIDFKTSEHAYQYYKTRDFDWQEAILGADTPSEAKLLGKRCPIIPNWDLAKDAIMYSVVVEKFKQNRELANRLLDTEDRYLEETNDWKDTYWGVCKGVGENKLGKILMDIRKGLRDGVIHCD